MKIKNFKQKKLKLTLGYCRNAVNEEQYKILEKFP